VFLFRLYLKPGQALKVDGIDLEAIEGKSVGEIIKIKRAERAEAIKHALMEEKRLKKEMKKRKKMESKAAEAEDSNQKRARLDVLEQKLVAMRFRPDATPSDITELEKQINDLKEKIKQMEAKK
jgi:polyhydroxyalkanoate synthesis regulator phasin